MISAGNNGLNGTQGQCPPQYGQQGCGYPQQPQGPTVGYYAPLQSPPAYNGMPNVNANVQLKPEVGADIIGTQMIVGGINTSLSQIGQMLTTGLNYALASESIEAQRDVAIKYYDTQDKIASYQQEVALEQVDVQRYAIGVQEDMHSAQITHEQKMARLEGATQARLAAIAESGKTKRAEILSMTDAFGANRNGWDMGSPLYS